MKAMILAAGKDEVRQCHTIPKPMIPILLRWWNFTTNATPSWIWQDMVNVDPRQLTGVKIISVMGSSLTWGNCLFVWRAELLTLELVNSGSAGYAAFKDFSPFFLMICGAVWWCFDWPRLNGVEWHKARCDHYCINEIYLQASSQLRCCCHWWRQAHQRHSRRTIS